MPAASPAWPMLDLTGDGMIPDVGPESLNQGSDLDRVADKRAGVRLDV
jgi:hypothetical protein